MRLEPFVITALLAVSACSGEEPPSCQQAVSHYYQAGCSYFDLSTGDPIPGADVVAACRDALSQAPASCDDEIDDWLFCMDGVPDEATSNADCDCSNEQEAILSCS